MRLFKNNKELIFSISFFKQLRLQALFVSLAFTPNRQSMKRFLILPSHMKPIKKLRKELMISMKKSTERVFGFGKREQS